MHGAGSDLLLYADETGNGIAKLLSRVGRRQHVRHRNIPVTDGLRTWQTQKYSCHRWVENLTDTEIFLSQMGWEHVRHRNVPVTDGLRTCQTQKYSCHRWVENMSDTEIFLSQMGWEHVRHRNIPVTDGLTTWQIPGYRNIPVTDGMTTWQTQKYSCDGWVDNMSDTEIFLSRMGKNMSDTEISLSLVWQRKGRNNIIPVRGVETTWKTMKIFILLKQIGVFNDDGVKHAR